MSRLRLPLALAISLGSAPALADPPKVVTDIMPVHALVSAVMEGVGTPTLLVDGSTSPHDFQLRPSQAAALQEAGLVVWMGEDLTPAIGRAVETLGDGAHSLELLEVNGITQLEFREGPLFDHEGHGEHGHEGHAEGEHGHEGHAEKEHGEGHGHEGHAEGEHDHEGHAEKEHGDGHGHEGHAEGEHDHEGHAEKEHGDGHGHEGHAEHEGKDHGEGHEEHAGHGHEGHHHDGVDPHAWLDPENAEVWLEVIAEELSELDPANAATYHANAEKAHAFIDAAVSEAAVTLEPVRGKAFMVFHDAYHYFEHRFRFEAAGAIAISDATDPGAARMAEIRDFLQDTGAVCIFAEPQFDPKLARVVSEGTGARIGTLDPLGSVIEPGPDAYPALIKSLAASLAECLAEG